MAEPCFPTSILIGNELLFLRPEAFTRFVTSVYLHARVPVG